MNKHFETCEMLLLTTKWSDDQILERLVSDLIESERLSDYRAWEIAKTILRLCK